MARTRVDLPFPFKGLSETMAFSGQEPNTTRSAQNVRARDPQTGRIRGAQRGGLTKHYANSLVNTTTEVSEIASVTVNNALLTYTQVAEVGEGIDAEEWGFAYPQKTTGIARENNNGGRFATADVRVDPYGNVYHALGVGAVTKFNPRGEQLTQFVVPIEDADATGQFVFITAIVVDAYQNVYVATGDEHNYAGRAFARIFCYKHMPDGGYVKAWSYDTEGHHVVDIAIFAGDLITLEVEFGVVFTTGNELDAANRPNTKLRVYPLAANTVLPPSTPTVDIDSALYAGNGGALGRRIAVREDGVVYVAYKSVHGTVLHGDYPASASEATIGVIRKYNPYGDTPSTVIWQLDGNDYQMGSDGDTNEGLGGIGCGLAAGKRDTATGYYGLYSCGPRVDANAGSPSGKDFDMIKIVDRGVSFGVDTGDSPVVGWGFSGATGGGAGSEEGLGESLSILARNRVRIAIDSDEGTVAFPYGGKGHTHPYAYVLNASTGAVISTLDDKEDSATDGSNYYGGLNGYNHSHASAVAFPPAKPTAGITEPFSPERIYVGTAHLILLAVSGGHHLQSHKLLSVAMAGSGGTIKPRTVVTAAVSNGRIYKIVGDPGGSSVVQGASGDLKTTAVYIQAAPLFEKLYFVDGLNTIVFDAAESSASASVTTWKSDTAGQVPDRCRLIEQWRGRMVLARDPEDPQNWHMSALGKPNDWDQFPTVVTSIQAISGNNARSGLVPDIVNTMVPFTDDVLLFGGDKSIWRLTGDPMAGGQLDQVSGDTGMSFGRPWCLDPNGVLYFFGSRGGVFRMTVRGDMERVSANAIERRLQDVDLGTHYIRLVWGYREEGLHVYQIPYTSTDAIVAHWFWEARADAWWEDRIGLASMNPTAVHLIDGDTVSDRFVLLGCHDGKVRRVDLGAVSDDGTGIDSYVTMGPMAPPQTGKQVLFSHPEIVLANDQGGAQWELFADNEPDDLGLSKIKGQLTAGRNPTQMARVRGDVVYMRLRNAVANEGWAYEKGAVYAASGGRLRDQ